MRAVSNNEGKPRLAIHEEQIPEPSAAQFVIVQCTTYVI
jgi:hypothetical protein